MAGTNKTTHIPVLLNAVLKYLNPKGGESYLDLTAGYGGHAQAILERTLAYEKAVLVDRDQSAVDYLARLYSGQRVNIIHTDFVSAAEQLVSGGSRFDMVLLDLGVSSPHLDTASRGFSFQKSGPLDMRMDQRQKLNAQDLVNTSSEAQLGKILREYGEEPQARRIAKSIVANRPITSTDELANIVAHALSYRGRHAKHHPATRTFQALRVAVNDELNQLRHVLPLVLRLLNPGGRLAIISFHSLEDRIVKDFIREHAGERYDADLKLLARRPVTAEPTEIVINPRARSAKLRVAVKLKTNI